MIYCQTISDYIDFSANEELWKEAPHMTGLGQSVYEDGIKKGIQTGIEALILNNIMEGISRERTPASLQKFYDLTEEKAEQYFMKVTAGSDV